MGVEYIKEFAFLQEVTAAGELWVAKGGFNNMYAVEMAEGGFSLPVWSNRERVVDFLKNARLVGAKYEPHAVPWDDFTRRWLSDMAMSISELQINPDGMSTRVLVVTAEELKTELGLNGDGPKDTIETG